MNGFGSGASLVVEGVGTLNGGRGMFVLACKTSTGGSLLFGKNIRKYMRNLMTLVLLLCFGLLLGCDQVLPNISKPSNNITPQTKAVPQSRFTSLFSSGSVPYENSLFDCLSHHWARSVRNISWWQCDFTGHWDWYGCCECSKSSNKIVPSKEFSLEVRGLSNRSGTSFFTKSKGHSFKRVAFLVSQQITFLQLLLQPISLSVLP